jgi:hypothetical protein
MDKRPSPGQPGTGKQAQRQITTGERASLVQVLRNSGRGGCVEVTAHFRMRAAQRGFSTPEALNVLKRGNIAGEPEFCPDFCNWKCSADAEHDDGRLVIVAAVCAGQEGQIWSPNVMLITGFIR